MNGENGNAFLVSLQKLAMAYGGRIDLKFVRVKDKEERSCDLLV